MKIVGYCRVSTASQSTKRQIAELTEHAQKQGYEVAEIFTEQISGAVKNEDRPQLIAMMEYVKTHSVDKVLTWELSRLGRSTLEVLKTVEALNDAKINLHIITTNLETLQPDGTVNPITRLVLTIMAELAAMERKQIRERMASGYRHHLQNGGAVGRKMGYRKGDDKMREDYAEVIKCLKKGISIEKTAKIANVSKSTVQRVKKRFSL